MRETSKWAWRPLAYDTVSVPAAEHKELRMISTNDVKPGMALDLEDGLFAIVSHQHVKPGKGKAFVRMRLKKIDTGQVLDRTFRADESVQRAAMRTAKAGTCLAQAPPSRVRRRRSSSRPTGRMPPATQEREDSHNFSHGGPAD